MPKEVKSPVNELDNQILFDLTWKEVQNVEANVLKFWGGLMQGDFWRRLMRARYADALQPVSFEEQLGTDTFLLGYIGKFKDSFGSDVDIFRLARNAPQQDRPHVTGITFGTINDGPRNQLAQLASLTLDFEKQPIRSVDYHFTGTRRLAVLQAETDPGGIFQTTDAQRANQYLWLEIWRGQGQAGVGLGLEAGYEAEELPTYSYVNYDGKLVKSKGVRVMGNALELFSVDHKSRLIHSSLPVCVPETVHQIGSMPMTLSV